MTAKERGGRKRAWIPGDAPRMTEGRKCASFSSPSPSVILTALLVRHSHRPPRPSFSPPSSSVILTEGGNPGYSVCVNPVRHSRRPPHPSFSPPSSSVILTEGGNPGYSVCVNPVRYSRRPPRPLFSPPSQSVILTEGGNPGWCSRWASRLTDGREGMAWIPEQGSRMTEGGNACFMVWNRARFSGDGLPETPPPCHIGFPVLKRKPHGRTHPV